MKNRIVLIVSLLLLISTTCFAINPSGYVRQQPRTGKMFLPDDQVVDVINSSGSVNVMISDQITPIVILPMVQLLATSTLAADTVIDTNTISVISAAGFTVGDHIRVISPANDRFYFGDILSISGNTVTVDTPMDYVHLSGSSVTVSNVNMAIDGSDTPVTFRLRTGTPSVASSIDVTRIIIACSAQTSVDLNKFGDLPALTNGYVFRRVGGNMRNIFNVKDNRELAVLGYDFTVLEASHPSQAVDGFLFRLTFAGQNKMGVAIRIDPEDNLEIIVQDDLSELVALCVMVEGHIVD